MLQGVLQKIGKSWRRRGLLGTLGHGFKKGWERILEYTPARRRARRLKEREDAEFDRAHGVDTGGVVTLDRLSVAGGNRELGVSYWAIGPDDFRRAVGAIEVR